MKIVVVLLLFCALVFSFLYWGVYSDGVRSGVITRVSERGVVFKTFEGEMNMQLLTSQDNQGLTTQTWTFSVEKSDQEIIKQLQKASLTGERVELRYVQRYMKFFWRGDTKYFIKEIILNK